jgi:hypothetical protein
LLYAIGNKSFLEDSRRIYVANMSKLYYAIVFYMTQI